jgi:GR25 family glycosyltransferase involved in LPS biosynthesis
VRDRVVKNTQFSSEKVRQLNARSGPNHRRIVSESEYAALTKIHVINLDRSTERWARFNRHNAHLANVLRSSAVDGAGTDRQQLIENGVMLQDCPYGNGALGCALSHVELWEKAHTEGRPVTVFEDDAIATFKFEEKARTLASNLPEDWDIVLWGHIVDPPRPWANVWVDAGFYKGNIHWFSAAIFDDWSEFQSIDYDCSLTPLLNAWGTVAYSVSPKGARMLLNACLPLRNRKIQFSEPKIRYIDEGIDGPMNGAYPSMKAFVCIPPLVAHDQSQTAVSDRKAIDRERYVIED